MKGQKGERQGDEHESDGEFFPRDAPGGSVRGNGCCCFLGMAARVKVRRRWGGIEIEKRKGWRGNILVEAFRGLICAGLNFIGTTMIDRNFAVCAAASLLAAVVWSYATIRILGYEIYRGMEFCGPFRLCGRMVVWSAEVGQDGLGLNLAFA